MKTLLTALVTCAIFGLTSIPVSAQLLTVGKDRNDFKDFKGSTLYVTATGHQGMDRALKEAFETYWTYTPVEFLPENYDTEEAFKDESKYFFAFITFTKTSGSTTTFSRTTDNLTLFRGHKKGFDKMDARNFLFGMPRAHYGNEDDLGDMVYRIKPFIKYMNDIFTAMDEEKSTLSTPMGRAKWQEETFPVRDGRLESKTLLIPYSFVKPDDVGDVKRAGAQGRRWSSSLDIQGIEKVYPHRFEVVSDEEIGKAIAEKRAGTAVLLPIISTTKVVFVIDTENYDVLHTDISASGLAMKKKDFKAITK